MDEHGLPAHLDREVRPEAGLFVHAFGELPREDVLFLGGAQLVAQPQEFRPQVVVAPLVDHFSGRKRREVAVDRALWPVQPARRVR